MSSKSVSIDEFVSRLNILMTEKGLNKSDLARISDVTPSYISEVTRGKKKPNIEIVVAIANNFPDVSLRWLLLGEGEIYEGGQADEDKEAVKQQIMSLLATI